MLKKLLSRARLELSLLSDDLTISAKELASGARKPKRLAERLRTILAVEGLEDRWCPDTTGFSWSGAGGNGDWTNPRNWNSTTYPGAGTNVNDWANFNAGGTRAPITITNVPAQLGGLNISDSNITISLSGNLTIKGGGTGNGDGQFNMSAGSVVTSGTAFNLILDDVGGADSHGGGPGLINGTGANVPVIGGPSYNNTLVLQDGTSMKMNGS